MIRAQGEGAGLKKEAAALAETLGAEAAGRARTEAVLEKVEADYASTARERDRLALLVDAEADRRAAATAAATQSSVDVADVASDVNTMGEELIRVQMDVCAVRGQLREMVRLRDTAEVLLISAQAAGKDKDSKVRAPCHKHAILVSKFSCEFSTLRPLCTSRSCMGPSCAAPRYLCAGCCRLRHTEVLVRGHNGRSTTYKQG
jgi:hypothetical protein